ncbi:MAG: MFS transporter [Burkholderiales bacterium]
MPRSEAMTPAELRASVGLAAIYGLRMLGMFVILPVFALYAAHLPGGTDLTLVGLALGAYGLTQGILQLPFGWLSDRLGRKPVIVGGLLLFALGSFIAASAHDIYMVILGRMVQGAGAISAAVMALSADLTRDEQRTKAMAVIGSTIGVAFALSLVLGPVLNRLVGVPGIFALTGVLALTAIAVLYLVVPQPGSLRAPARAGDFRAILRHPELLRLDFGIFVLHAALMSVFAVVPFALEKAGLAVDQHWHVYLPVMLGSFVLMLPGILYADRESAVKTVFVTALVLLLAAQVLMALWLDELWAIGGLLLLFFTAFNILEASLPSLVTRIAPFPARGAALGVYSSVQFLGAFAGAAAAGYLYQHHGAGSVFAFAAAATTLWLGFAATMRGPPPLLVTRTYAVPAMGSGRAKGLSQQLAALPGVRKAEIRMRDGIACLRVELRSFDEQRALSLIKGD